MLNVQAVFTTWVQLIAVPLQLMIFFVLVDFLTGVLSALRRQKFDWRAIGNFYVTDIVPKFGGYLIFSAAGVVVALPEVVTFIPAVVLQPLDEIIGWGGFAAAALPLVLSIVRNATEIYKPNTPEPPPAPAPEPI